MEDFNDEGVIKAGLFSSLFNSGSSGEFQRRWCPRGALGLALLLSCLCTVPVKNFNDEGVIRLGEVLSTKERGTLSFIGIAERCTGLSVCVCMRVYVYVST